MASNLSETVKKKKSFLNIMRYTTYWLFTLLFLGSILGAIAYKYEIFIDRSATRVSGYVLLILIVFLYFTYKDMVALATKFGNSKHNMWFRQVIQILPLVVVLGLIYLVYIRIYDFVFILEWLIIFRVLYSPLDILHEYYRDKYLEYTGLIKKNDEDQKYEQFKKENAK
jgi:hypothetical protein